MATQPKFVPVVTPPRTVWKIALWVAQVVLAVIYGMAGAMKATSPIADLVQMGLAWAADAPVPLVRFIGCAELAGAVGLILPALTRIAPGLTPLAALGLSLIQVLALPLHLSRGEYEMAPVNLMFLALSAFVLWGRARKAPIAPRT